MDIRLSAALQNRSKLVGPTLRVTVDENEDLVNKVMTFLDVSSGICKIDWPSQIIWENHSFYISRGHLID